MSLRYEKMEDLKASINNLEILDEIQTLHIEELILKKIVFIPSGVIGWKSYPNNIIVLDIKDIIKKITNKNCYVMWDEGTLPIVKTDLDSIGNNTFEFTRISFDTWIVGDSFDWVIEFHHSGVVRYTEL